MQPNNQATEPPATSKSKWITIGILMLASPIIYIAVASLWNLLYGEIFNPPGGGIYSWAVSIAAMYLIITAPIPIAFGVTTLILSRGTPTRRAVLARRILSIIFGVASVILLLVYV